ncbi:MAG: DUF2911 domain-containing protein [Phaeodactylibacter sp.]|nr:DUF2911 domain-containing protein [Phaeodactylibacter sp.]
MKRITFLLALAFALTNIQLSAQISTPAPSPGATVKQTVGMTDFTIQYSRPGMKDREIFGGLVPYGEMWRTGANAATKLTISDDVKLNKTLVKAGDYALFTKPGATEWEIHLFPYTSPSAGAYGEAEAAAMFKATPKAMPMKVESFMIYFDDLRDETATLHLAWDKTNVSIDIMVDSYKQAMASIDKTLNGPTNDDYYAAGVYLANYGKDMDKALEYIQKATHSDSPKFWQVRQESEVLAKMGKTKEAIAAAKKSLKLAEEAGNKDYVRINTQNIEKWSNM